MSHTHQTFEVLVIGSGHAGCEAALAAARMGAQTAVITPRPERSGWMPCNPAIGGVGKGQLVREIDALGGEQAHCIDATGIQFRRLNTRKGPAVQSRRAQADMFEYADRMSEVVQNTPNLTVIPSKATGLLHNNQRVEGVVLEDGSKVHAQSVIVTTGTFLRGLLHKGEEATPGGRVDEGPSNTLSDSLRELGLPLLRLKTGTPARLDTNTIDYAQLEPQYGDQPPLPFSFMNDEVAQQDQVACHITYTNERTHEIINSGIDRSPLFNGQIQGIGPRYCPSIEDKVVRFPDRLRHQIFLEPVARNSPLVYPNGISTSLPEEIQIELVRSIAGLEDAKIITMGYAVEYDAVEPQSLHPWLEVRDVQGLFLAGQINGTSGYEEAAGQGLIAGINAVRHLRHQEPFVLDRTQGYIGVMIDDLTTRGVSEPYRMFTSRAEYRLLLREDNADQRLTPLGREIGLVSDARWRRFNEKMDAIASAKETLDTFQIPPGPNGAHYTGPLGISPIKNKTSLFELLRRSDLETEAITTLDTSLSSLRPDALEQLFIQQRYAGYLQRQEQEAALFREGESITIPEDFCYEDVPGLRAEMQEKLGKTRPRSLGQAARIPGITPAALQLLTVMLNARQKDLSSEKNSL